MEPQRTPETHDQAIHRLAEKAKTLGVQIFIHVRSGEYFATSTSSPDQLHRVTLVSCECEGFLRWQRCTHHSALLAELDELPPLPPTSANTVAAGCHRFGLTDAELTQVRGEALRVSAMADHPLEWYWSDPAA